MKKITILALSILILSGCQTIGLNRGESGLKVEKTDNSVNENVNINVQMANPASTNCLEKGGRLEGKTDQTGDQFSICIFKDDTRCEEWSYFRGECQPGKNIIVFEPKKDQEVTLPITITGQSRVFENTFNYRLKDAQGEILNSGIGMSNSPEMGVFGDFNISINSLSQIPSNPNVTLEVLDYSAKDGSEINLVSIPLKLIIDQTSQINLYFSNDKLDPQITCTKVFPVKRFIAKTTAIGQASLSLLLAGPTNEEYKDGYRTNINSYTKLNSLNITNKIATADFDETLQAQVGGSCRVGAISAQITETLKQFPSVEKVIISVNGQSEDVLQP